MKANSRWWHGNWGVALGALAAFVLGLLVRGCFVSSPRSEPSAAEGRGAASVETWTCSMHPQIRQPKFGQCPICGMDLIPVPQDSGVDAAQPRQLRMSSLARQLAEVEVVPVARRAVTIELRLAGKVQFDETRLATIAPRVAGRIDRLYANFTGMQVMPGDPLADLYSPELVSAQQELLQALKTPQGTSAFGSVLDATRERLRLWGLTAEQIADIEQRGQVRDHITFYAPLGGIVVQMEAREGLYVEEGMRLFTLADLSEVWVQLDAYESDLAWLRDGQEVDFETEAYPGERFKGTIAFIDPLLDPMTRTVKVRVQAVNADGRLKPEMFVRAVVHAVADEGAEVPPLVIPDSAPLVTGKRAVVYVAVPDKEGVYEGREVVLGPRAGDYFLVREGLQEGEQVVVRGAFKIDSSLQIQAKPSMMAPEGGSVPDGRALPESAPLIVPVPELFRKQLNGVLDQVLRMGDALADDNMEAAKVSVSAAQEALAAVDMAILEGDAHDRWMESLRGLTPSLEKMAAGKNIESVRVAFEALSSGMTRAAKLFGPLRSESIYVMHCPMAFNNRGASWLQKDKAVRNPYFGDAMLACGEVIETIPVTARPPEEKGHAHE